MKLSRLGRAAGSCLMVAGACLLMSGSGDSIVDKAKNSWASRLSQNTPKMTFGQVMQGYPHAKSVSRDTFEHKRFGDLAVVTLEMPVPDNLREEMSKTAP